MQSPPMGLFFLKQPLPAWVPPGPAAGEAKRDDDKHTWHRTPQNFAEFYGQNKKGRLFWYKRKDEVDVKEM